MNALRAGSTLFEFLDSTRQGILERLRQLPPLVDAIELGELNATYREQARSILHYFNTEARQHHLDEEKHIFPVLLASHNAEIEHTTARLIQDHRWLAENWLQIAPSLDAAVNGNLWFDRQELRHAVEVFEALYIDHILLEESIAYPEAKERMAAYDAAGMGREMAQRRFRAARAHSDAEGWPAS